LITQPAWILSGVAISVPWLAAAMMAVYRRDPRVIGFGASLVSVVASALLLRAAPSGQSLFQALMLLFSCLTLAATLMLPRRDCNSATIGGILFLLGATLLAYASGNLLVLLVAWILSTIPFLLKRWFRARTWRPAAGLVLSTIALALAIGLISASGHMLSIDALKGRSPGGLAAFALLVVAVMFRKGICPAHA
jgi:hypothetical protein